MSGSASPFSPELMLMCNGPYMVLGPGPGRETVPHYSSPRKELLACQHGAEEEAGCHLHPGALE